MYFPASEKCKKSVRKVLDGPQKIRKHEKLCFDRMAVSEQGFFISYFLEGTGGSDK